MRDKDGTVIYVGKAKSLRKRVASYFNAGKDRKTRVLVNHIDSLEYIVTETEYEALLLENTLIKKHSPRYNINLKDGKSYPVIKITNEEFPRVFRTRRVIRDGSRYFGPFPSVIKIDTYLELIERLFPTRKCRGKLKERVSPCLYYHIHRCAAPCCRLIGEEEYTENIERIADLLSGKADGLLTKLEREMRQAATALNFEKAAELRDTIASIRDITTEQRVVDFDDQDRDYIACSMEEHLCTFSVLGMRSGKITGQELYREEIFESTEEAMAQFLIQYYGTNRTPPRTVYLSEPVDDDLYEEYFRKHGFTQVRLKYPQRGRHAAIMAMAGENCKLDLIKRVRSLGDGKGLEELKIVLDLPNIPRRIEGFDIAHLEGTHTVASLVTFSNGIPDKSGYRRYRLRSLQGKVDDFEAVREVVARRYSRILNEDLDRPDLVLIDGGRGQVSAAKGIMASLGLDDLPVAGLAKQHEEIWLPGRNTPIRLPETSPALKVLQHVRDETHRFATDYNKRLRKKDGNRSILEQVPGIGPKRSRVLLKEFGSLSALAAAEPKAMTTRTGLPEDLAEQVAEQINTYLAAESDHRD